MDTQVSALGFFLNLKVFRKRITGVILLCFQPMFHEHGRFMKLDVTQTIQTLILKCKGWFQCNFSCWKWELYVLL